MLGKLSSVFRAHRISGSVVSILISIGKNTCIGQKGVSTTPCGSAPLDLLKHLRYKAERWRYIETEVRSGNVEYINGECVWIRSIGSNFRELVTEPRVKEICARVFFQTLPGCRQQIRIQTPFHIKVDIVTLETSFNIICSCYSTDRNFYFPINAPLS